MSDVSQNPRVMRAAKSFVDTVTKDGGSCTITTGGKSVTIGGPVPTADGTVDQQHNSATAEYGPELPLRDPEGVKSRNRPGGMNVGRLKGFIERIEKLEEERQALGGDLRDIYSEAKGTGYDVKTIRKVVALRKMDAADRDEQETLLDVYKHALGMV